MNIRSNVNSRANDAFHTDGVELATKRNALQDRLLITKAFQHVSVYFDALVGHSTIVGDFRLGMSHDTF